jgi:hypothetical protein
LFRVGLFPTFAWEANHGAEEHSKYIELDRSCRKWRSVTNQDHVTLASLKQAAINMGGTHVHLGTYVEEQEAAVAFDRAALIVRGRWHVMYRYPPLHLSHALPTVCTGIDKAKINFPVSNYCDANGQLIIDPQTSAKLQAR